ncbi:hypothetical protein DBV15_03162 [Temnothorax longispinosus]|uniref:Uncharacterized protein n=1 Tax=Temnothorax longispinosus TaxID=300112 RepID=A0A4S2KT15_9HYME|nr:hypothetical protein DBV15_03162 [Temnothorax longispinosus]
MSIKVGYFCSRYPLFFLRLTTRSNAVAAAAPPPPLRCYARSLKLKIKRFVIKLPAKCYKVMGLGRERKAGVDGRQLIAERRFLRRHESSQGARSFARGRRGPAKRRGPNTKMTGRITDVSIVVKLRLWHSCPDGGPQTSSETSNAAGDHCLRGIPRASHDEGPTPKLVFRHGPHDGPHDATRQSERRTPTRCIRRKGIPVNVVERDGHTILRSRLAVVYPDLTTKTSIDSTVVNGITFDEPLSPKRDRLEIYYGDSRNLTDDFHRSFGNKPREAGIARLAYHSVSNFYIGHCLFRHRTWNHLTVEGVIGWHAAARKSTAGAPRCPAVFPARRFTNRAFPWIHCLMTDFNCVNVRQWPSSMRTKKPTSYENTANSCGAAADAFPPSVPRCTIAQWTTLARFVRNESLTCAGLHFRVRRRVWRDLLVGVCGENLFRDTTRALSLFLFALDNSVSSSKLPSIVVVLLVRGLIESSRGSFATAPDPIVHSIIGAGNETQDYLLRKKTTSDIALNCLGETVCETLALDSRWISREVQLSRNEDKCEMMFRACNDYHAIIYRSLLKSTDTNSMKSSSSRHRDDVNDANAINVLDRSDFGAERREARLRRHDLSNATIQIWRNIIARLSCLPARQEIPGGYKRSIKAGAISTAGDLSGVRLERERAREKFPLALLMRT